MPRFASAVAARPERRVILIAHYDATLLAYYLGDVRTIEPLVLVHQFDPESERNALGRLQAAASAEPVLVIDRDALQLETIRGFLRGCETLVEAPTGRLYRCGR